MTGLGNWVPEAVELPPGEWIQHLDGIPWDQAPRPGRWHRCRAQTRGFIFGEYMERCRCGALWHYGAWIERNSLR